MDYYKVLNPYIESIEKGLEDKHWLLSIITACTLPEICTTLEGKKSVGDTYVTWFDNFVTDYNVTVTNRRGMLEVKTLQEYEELMKQKLKPEDIETHNLIYFNGVVAYAFRCSLLHNGNGDVYKQHIFTRKEYKDRTLNIRTIVYDNDTESIISLFNETCFLNPEAYCRAILNGVDNWIQSKK